MCWTIPQEWAAFSRASDGASGLDESNVVIEGMTCAACAVTIEQALRAMPGVQRAEVSAASHRAYGRLVARRRCSLRGWMAAIRAAGYVPLPANDSSARAARLKREPRRPVALAGRGPVHDAGHDVRLPGLCGAPGDLSAESEQLLRWASWVLTLPVMLFSCGPFFRNALRDLAQRRISMDLPVALAW